MRELEDFDINVQITDAYADPQEAHDEHGIDLIPYENLKPADAAIFAVPHEAYVSDGWNMFDSLLKHGKGIVFDVKSKLDKKECPDSICLNRL